MDLQEVSALEILMNGLTGGVPDPHQAGHAVGLRLTAGLLPHELRLDKPPGLERVSRLTLPDQAQLLRLELHGLSRVVALYQAALHLHAGVERHLVRNQLCGRDDLNVMTAGAITDVKEGVLLLFPEALDPALDSDWLGQVRDGSEDLGPDTGQVTLADYERR